jgi:hypothetical protein
VSILRAIEAALDESPELKDLFDEVKRNAVVEQPPITFTRGELSALRTGLAQLRIVMHGSESAKADEKFTGGTLRKSVDSAERKLEIALDAARANSIKEAQHGN